MEKIIIRVAIPEDSKSIKQVNHDSWIEAYPNSKLGITVEDIRERVDKNMTPAIFKSFGDSLLDIAQHTWVAEIEGEIIGYATARKGAEFNKLEAIYVLADYYGQNVGKKLIETAFMWLGTDKNIEVEVASYNDRAIRFYEKNGFKRNGRTGNSGDIPTIYLVH